MTWRAKVRKSEKKKKNGKLKGDEKYKKTTEI